MAGRLTARATTEAQAVRRPRVGIVGFGFIGQALYRRIADDPALGLRVAFVHDDDAARLDAVPDGCALAALDDLHGVDVDLVIECAAPAVTVAHGASLLRRADYLTLSTTALADATLLAELIAVALSAGTRLLIPHGALAGLDALHERGAAWREVTVTFRKPPSHIDGAAPTGDGPVVLYDGPVRGIASRYPRNVNAMVACVLATVGLDACRGVLVSDPRLDELVVEVRAIGEDGSVLEIVKRQPGVGVSGTEMPDALLRSVLLAVRVAPGLAFV